MKGKYIIECPNREDAENLFKALEMIGFKFDTNVFNPDDNYCWDVNMRATVYQVSENGISYGGVGSYKFIIDWHGFEYLSVRLFIEREVKLRHRIKYWFKKKIEML